MPAHAAAHRGDPRREAPAARALVVRAVLGAHRVAQRAQERAEVVAAQALVLLFLLMV